MSGAINFSMTDLYGAGYGGTTDMTIPEAADQNALVDDESAAETVAAQSKNKVNVFLAIALVVVIALVIGAVNR